MRISRQVASMSAGVSRPLPRRLEKTVASRSERVSNTKEASLPVCWERRLELGRAIVPPRRWRCPPRPCRTAKLAAKPLRASIDRSRTTTCRPTHQLEHNGSRRGHRPPDAVRHQRRAARGRASPSRRGEVLVLLGPERGRQDHHHRDPRGLPAAVRRRRSRCSARTRRPRDEAWRSRIGVVLQSWRDHGRWRVRELLDHLGSFYVPYSEPDRPRPYPTDELIETVGLDRAPEQEGLHALRRATPPARRRDRHRRPPGAALPGRADRRLRPGRPARLPRPRAPAVRPSGHHDPAHHPRPGRGGEARRPDPDPERRPDRRQRQRRRTGARRRRHAPRCAGPRTGSGRCIPRRSDRFVRDLFAQERARRTVRRHQRSRGAAAQPGEHLPDHGRHEQEIGSGTQSEQESTDDARDRALRRRAAAGSSS